MRCTRCGRATVQPGESLCLLCQAKEAAPFADDRALSNSMFETRLPGELPAPVPSAEPPAAGPPPRRPGRRSRTALREPSARTPAGPWVVATCVALSILGAAFILGRAGSGGPAGPPAPGPAAAARPVAPYDPRSRDLPVPAQFGGEAEANRRLAEERFRLEQERWRLEEERSRVAEEERQAALREEEARQRAAREAENERALDAARRREEADTLRREAVVRAAETLMEALLYPSACAAVAARLAPDAASPVFRESPAAREDLGRGRYRVVSGADARVAGGERAHYGWICVLSWRSGDLPRFEVESVTLVPGPAGIEDRLAARPPPSVSGSDEEPPKPDPGGPEGSPAALERAARSFYRDRERLICSACGGDGRQRCDACDASGQELVVTPTGTARRTCRVCGGYRSVSCASCEGGGINRRRAEEILDILAPGAAVGTISAVESSSVESAAVTGTTGETTATVRYPDDTRGTEIAHWAWQDGRWYLVDLSLR